MNPASLLLPLLLSACTTLGDYQATCEKRHQKFEEFASCFRSEVTSDSRGIPAKDPRVKLLLLKTEQLSRMVSSGQMSDLDAKVEFQQIFVSLKSQAMAESNDIQAPIRQAPVRTTCTTAGGVTNCKSR